MDPMKDGANAFINLLSQLCDGSLADRMRQHGQEMSLLNQTLTQAQPQEQGDNVPVATSALVLPHLPLPMSTQLNPILYEAYHQLQQAKFQSQLPQTQGTQQPAMLGNMQKLIEMMAVGGGSSLLQDGLRQPPFLPIPTFNPRTQMPVTTRSNESSMNSCFSPCNPLLQLQFPGLPTLGALANLPQPASSLTSPLSTDSETSSSATTNNGTTLGAGSSPLVSTTFADDRQQQLLPSNDKEGWCRNKKYIEVVKKGYKCLVCNKIYGRYNSVSYHVTIYHRNPPIKCEEESCQFTTREARYIHFHKYYKHQIPLPNSIDLASRKCPLEGCKHVSKSPAMLDKHMHRHVTDSLKEGAYHCGECHQQFMMHEEMFKHLRDVHSRISLPGRSSAMTSKEKSEGSFVSIGTIESPEAPRAKSNEDSNTGSKIFACEFCHYKSRTVDGLEKHSMFKHSTNTVFNLPMANGRQLIRRRTSDCFFESMGSMIASPQCE